MAIAIFLVFFVLILLNIPIAVSLGLASATGLLMYGLPLSVLPNLMYSSVAKFVLLAIPYFILAGFIMDRAGISKRLINLASAFVGHVRHGMLVVVVVATCFYSAMTGSGPATVAALGSVLIPAMITAGYNPALATALMSSAGGLGIIIPPSIAFVVYASISDVSISKLFSGGVFPGLLVAAAFLVAAIISSRGDKTVLKQQLPRASAKVRWHALKEAFWGLLTPVIVLGGIYGGIFTPTEAAGVAIVYSLILGVFIYREIKIKDLYKIFIDSAVTSGVVMYIVACASIFAWIMTTSHIATDMSNALMSLSHNKIVLMLLFNLVFILVGLFVDPNSAMYIMVPVMLPVVRTLGIDLIHFGVIITVNLALGQVTPPVAVNLAVGCNISKVPMIDAFRRIGPFVFWGIVALLIVTFVPQLTMFLANLTRQM